jgi:hypothetical protein
MKMILFCVLLATGSSGFAIEESNILAAGEWSAPVTNQLGDATIRGRLLLCEVPARPPFSGTDTALYLELQECSGAIGNEIAIRQGYNALRCSVVDRSGVNMSERFSGFMSWPPRCNVNLAPYSSFRFRVSPYGSGRSKNGDWNFALPGGGFCGVSSIHTDIFITGTFSIPAPEERPAADKSHNTWNGTLLLPPVKLLTRKPVQT